MKNNFVIWGAIAFFIGAIVGKLLWPIIGGPKTVLTCIFLGLIIAIISEKVGGSN